MLSLEIERQWLIPVALSSPPLDAGEETLDPRPVAMHDVARFDGVRVEDFASPASVRP